MTRNDNARIKGVAQDLHRQRAAMISPAVHFLNLKLTMLCLKCRVCFCSTSGGVIPSLTDSVCHDKEGAMKALALLTAAALTLLSVAGCAQYADGYYGKGKAPPPPPVVTKG
jgi:hypothetical protein